jgi:hypothetical protein
MQISVLVVTMIGMAASTSIQESLDGALQLIKACNELPKMCGDIDPPANHHQNDPSTHQNDVMYYYDTELPGHPQLLCECVKRLGEETDGTCRCVEKQYVKPVNDIFHELLGDFWSWTEPFERAFNDASKVVADAEKTAAKAAEDVIPRN